MNIFCKHFLNIGIDKGFVFGKYYIFTYERMFATIIIHLQTGRGVKELEEKVHEGILIANPVNIPIQMVSLTDRDGRMTPLWFRLETEEHEIKKYKIEQVVSRDEKQYVGVREKQFICKISLGEISRTLEMRYSIETQKWRIFQFL